MRAEDIYAAQAESAAAGEEQRQRQSQVREGGLSGHRTGDPGRMQHVQNAEPHA